MMNPAFVNSSIFLDVFIEKSKHCITRMMAGQANEDGEVGGHLCLGKPFSLLEQVVFLGLLLRDYKVSVREELKISTGGIFAPEPYTLYLKKLK